jgi:predicted MPP superfamily phosphohydrolase
MSTFAIASWVTYVSVVLIALRTRGRFFATFLAVGLGLFTLVSVPLRPHLHNFGLLPDYLQTVVYLHFLLYLWPRLRPLPFRIAVSFPASFFAAATLLAWPWAIVAALGFAPHGLYAPYGLALLGLFQALYTRESVRELVLDDRDAGALRRYPMGRANAAPALRIIQITDPHLGPFMPVSRLRRICERAVARAPDLIFLTGDLLTVESNREPHALPAALRPLLAMRGRVFACLGNHDHEAPHIVRHALEDAGVTLLVDAAVELDTPVGRLQVLGFNHRHRGRKAQMAEVCARFPKPEGALRIVLLHDPGAFTRLPPGEGDLVLSGHTHGGQLGLVSFGLPWTFVSMVSKLPDHGLWARGKDRLYVHRGTGHYGFPLRVGVPAEQSMLHIRRGRPSTGA